MKLTCKSSPPLSCHQAHSVIQTHTTQDLTFLSKKKCRFEYPKRTSSITYHWLHGSFIRDFNSILHADFSKAVHFLSFFLPALRSSSRVFHIRKTLSKIYEHLTLTPAANFCFLLDRHDTKSALSSLFGK